jgi:hypothetical protein
MGNETIPYASDTERWKGCHVTLGAGVRAPIASNSTGHDFRHYLGVGPQMDQEFRMSKYMVALAVAALFAVAPALAQAQVPAHHHHHPRHHHHPHHHVAPHPAG